MTFRRSIAPPSEIDWIMGIREDLEVAQHALSDMMLSEKGTVKKDRHSLAMIFRDVARVLETKSIEGTRFAKQSKQDDQ